MKTKQIAIDAMLAAMCAVLGYVSLDLGNMKFTFEAFPILLGALLLGPVDGMIIAAVGTGIYQILKYGLMSTTILWIIPYVIYALYVGLLRKKNLWFVVFSSGIIVTLLNTGVIYLDSIIWDYYTFTYVFGSFIFRIITSLIKSLLVVLIIKKIWNSIEKVLKNSQN
ncbi:MAG: ECF transporter S component [Bacillota bacterium]|nr:ECF transporter S component [Bacillota bacterium]